MTSRRKAGFSLLEVLVAISLLAICGVMLLDVAGNGMWTAKKADDKNRALCHAREVLEQILSDVNTDLRNTPVSQGDFNDGFLYKAVVEELPIDNSVAASQQHILIKVTVFVYQEENGQKRLCCQLDSVKVMLDERREPVPQADPNRQPPRIEFPRG